MLVPKCGIIGAHHQCHICRGTWTRDQHTGRTCFHATFREIARRRLAGAFNQKINTAQIKLRQIRADCQRISFSLHNKALLAKAYLAWKSSKYGIMGQQIGN